MPAQSGRSARECAAAGGFEGPMQKWASEYGLSLEQVQTAVDKWSPGTCCRDGSKTTSRCVWRTTVKNSSSKRRAVSTKLGQKDVQELEQLKAQVLDRTERAVRRFCEGC